MHLLDANQPPARTATNPHTTPPTPFPAGKQAEGTGQPRNERPRMLILAAACKADLGARETGNAV
ncbi:hypothetical protein GCM10009546_55120 [Actinomadura livida]|uniref:Uncharacterized protein n=1 Tax=Actinomadura livida TaxID=79909 RepID=A0ABN1F9Q6_9ACTN|nr:hypothetical protein GCM10010208_10320 [Actinomadura livida]